tara:strand:+ start:124 stop:381 length:258 start_codon:yes stop_codon:yes gene_type:complete
MKKTKGESMNKEKINKWISDKTVFIYKSRKETVKGYIMEVKKNGYATFIVYAPTRLSDCQVWIVSMNDLLKDSTITNDKATWGRA